VASILISVSSRLDSFGDLVSGHLISSPLDVTIDQVFRVIHEIIEILFLLLPSLADLLLCLVVLISDVLRAVKVLELACISRRHEIVLFHRVQHRILFHVLA